MANKRTIIVLDTETSGLDENEQEIVEIYAKALNAWDFEDHHAGTFHAYIKPQFPEKAQARAIEVIGQEAWLKAQNEGALPQVAFQKFLEWAESTNSEGGVMGKPIFMAYNKDFDSKFIRTHCIKHKLVKKSEWGWEFPWSFEFDVMGVAFMLLENDPSVPNFKLETILNKFGLKRKNPKVHSAQEDVELMAEWLKRAFKFCRECNKRMKIQ